MIVPLAVSLADGSTTRSKRGARINHCFLNEAVKTIGAGMDDFMRQDDVILIKESLF